MDLDKKILDKIDNLVKLSGYFDNGFKIIYDLDSSKINSENVDILFDMTKNYINIRKEHGEIILILNKYINLNTNLIDLELSKKEPSKTDNKKIKSETPNSKTEQDFSSLLYGISTFNTLLNNINDLINNIDYEYKKIAIKYPKFINSSPITIILVHSSNPEDTKYTDIIDELKLAYPEYKYKIINCNEDKTDISHYEDVLKDFDIKIKLKSLPLIYIVNKSTITEIPIGKIQDINPIKKLIE